MLLISIMSSLLILNQTIDIYLVNRTELSFFSVIYLNIIYRFLSSFNYIFIYFIFLQSIKIICIISLLILINLISLLFFTIDYFIFIIFLLYLWCSMTKQLLLFVFGVDLFFMNYFKGFYLFIFFPFFSCLVYILRVDIFS